MKRSPKRCPTHPGAWLREITRDRSRTEVASAIGISRMTLYNLLNESQAVTPEMAVRLGHVFGTSPESWLGLQNAFDLWHARLSPTPSVQKSSRNG